tara:strand:- start:17 stop:1027 length:1011 start_codon:yes stop_codon:yes gene_type:complete
MANLNIKKSLATLAFFTLPMPGKIIGAVAAAFVKNVKIKKIYYILIFLSSLIILTKAAYVVDLSGLIWSLKPFLFIIGVGVGAYFLNIKNYEFSILINIAAITCLLIMLVQFFYFDIWSGSGDYRGRPTAGMRGFGEFSILAFFFVQTKIGLISSLLVALFSGSKIILLGIGLGLAYLIFYRKVKIKLSLFVYSGIVLLVFFYWNLNSLFTVGQAFGSFTTSVIECGIDCTSYTNRLDGTSTLFKDVYDNPLRLLLGIEKDDAFQVNPEIGIFYLLKIGGLFLVILIYGLLFSSLSGFQGRNFLFLLPLIDAYCLSPVSFILFGFISAVKFKLNQI